MFPTKKSVPINIPGSVVPLSVVPLKCIPVSNAVSKYVANTPFINTPPSPFVNSPNKLFLLHLNRRLDKNINSISDKC